MSSTDVPDELADLLHTAAGAAPPYHADLATVRERGRTYRRRRMAAIPGAAVLVAAAMLAVPLVTGGLVARPDAGDSLSMVPSEPLDPVWLLVAPYTVFTEAEAQAYVASEGQEQVPEDYGELYGELRPDGSTVERDLDTPGAGWIYRVTAMPAGRLAALTIAWSGDGECEQIVGTIWLHVIEPDGSVSLSRELEPATGCEDGQTPTLMSADNRNVYVHRGSQLVAHELATGREQVLVDSPEVLAQGFRASVAGGRVVMVIPTGCEATVRVMESDAGATRDYPLPPAGCPMPVGPFQVSPDGRYAAAALNRGHELRLAVTDLDTGEVMVDELIVAADGTGQYRGSGYSERAIETTYGGISGLTWIDASTVRVAWYEPPAHLAHWTDAIQPTDFTVPPSD